MSTIKLKAIIAESYSIEYYGNYKKEPLYSREVKIFNEESNEEIKNIKVVFVSYLEEITLRIAMNKEFVFNYCNPSLVNPMKQAVNFPVNIENSKDKIFKENLPVFEYFNLSEEKWERLISETYSSFLEVEFLRDIQDKLDRLDIFSMKLEDIIKLISENVDKFRNKQISVHLLQFLNLSSEQQELVVHDIKVYLDILEP